MWVLNEACSCNRVTGSHSHKHLRPQSQISQEKMWITAVSLPFPAVHDGYPFSNTHTKIYLCLSHIRKTLVFIVSDPGQIWIQTSLVSNMKMNQIWQKDFYLIFRLIFWTLFQQTVTFHHSFVLNFNFSVIATKETHVVFTLIRV